MTGSAGAPTAVVLAGGAGTRLRPVVSDRPKPMAEVAGRPFLEWLLLALRDQGVQHVVLCTGVMGETIRRYFGSGARLGMHLVCSQEPAPLGTAGAVRLALSHVTTSRVLVINGDSYCRFDLELLLRAHREREAVATMWLVPCEDCRRYGSVTVDAGEGVTAFEEKSPEQEAGLISAGVYLFDRDLLQTIPGGRPVSLETEVLPGLVGKGLHAIVGPLPFLDIGTPEAYAAASGILLAEQRDRPASAGDVSADHPGP